MSFSLNAIKAAASTAVAPYRLYIELFVIVAIVVGVLWYRHSLIEHGKQIEKDAAAKVAAAQVIHNTEVETRAKTLSEAQVAAFKATLSSPPPADAPVLRCVSNSHPSRVPKDAGPGPSNNAAPEPAAVVPQPSEDLGPEIDAKLRDADALILVLQQRIENEVGVCR